jgi:hypothetical protein
MHGAIPPLPNTSSWRNTYLSIGATLLRVIFRCKLSKWCMEYLNGFDSSPNIVGLRWTVHATPMGKKRVEVSDPHSHKKNRIIWNSSKISDLYSGGTVFESPTQHRLFRRAFRPSGAVLGCFYHFFQTNNGLVPWSKSQWFPLISFTICCAWSIIHSFHSILNNICLC